ncbi:DUF7547 family protein [Halococcus agarilyticus]|uniref:DUF7547 family protein n=1 Tax=Halococcus agarilyticus TaxID=1232219 RepID=UPI00067806F4|nr:hypothetical protein [Halococcus agarilyticus]
MSDRPDGDRRSGDDRRQERDRNRGADPDLERLAGDLSTTLDDLRDELEGERGPPRGPLGLPRPPTPGELVRFTDEYTIPTLIAVLEANIRLLEALQGAIRLARTGERGREMRALTGELGRDGLDRLDDVLVDLQDALDGRPENPEARTLLDDARALRHEIDDRLAEAGNGRRPDATRPRDTADGERDDVDPEATDDSDEGVAIDVDSELDSIRDEVDGDDDGEEDS